MQNLVPEPGAEAPEPQPSADVITAGMFPGAQQIPRGGKVDVPRRETYLSEGGRKTFNAWTGRS